jgi:hypothetical protein
MTLERRGLPRERPSARQGETLFAASNSSLLDFGNDPVIVTGGASGSRSRSKQYNFQHDPYVPCRFVGGNIPLAVSKTAGAFSVATSGGNELTFDAAKPDKWVGGPYGKAVTLVVVGGDFQRQNDSKGTAAFSADGGQHWTVSSKSPHGYRSSVAYDRTTKTWITVGPNGTDISTDDGRTWNPVLPNAATEQQSGEDRDWNAISLPFVVGPRGRIGRLRDGVLK